MAMLHEEGYIDSLRDRYTIHSSCVDRDGDDEDTEQLQITHLTVFLVVLVVSYLVVVCSIGYRKCCGSSNINSGKTADPEHSLIPKIRQLLTVFESVVAGEATLEDLRRYGVAPFSSLSTLEDGTTAGLSTTTSDPAVAPGRSAPQYGETGRSFDADSRQLTLHSLEAQLAPKMEGGAQYTC
jgi:hypothetical protein